MKRMGGLFDAIVDRGNFSAAVGRAAAGKRDRPAVREFLADLDRELAVMRERIADGSWRFSSYTSFQVRDTKTRMIHAPAFRDRVAHHAMIRVTGPVFEMGALRHSYACRAGRGQHAALAAARRWTRRAGWYGKLDVEKFYDSVDHAVLRRLLARRFRERRVLRLFDALLDSWESSPGKGLPIGALTSQHLGNFYLDELDRRVKATRLAPRYLRYMDDVVVWGDLASLARVRAVAQEALASLGLRLKHGGEWNRCERGIPLLGFVVYPDRVRLGRQGRRRLRRNLRNLERSWERGTINEQALQHRGTSLFAHAAAADDSAWRRTVLSLGRLRDGGREAQEPRPRDPRRLLEQHRQEVPGRVSQQEGARQPQQEPGLPGLSGSRHDDTGERLLSSDDAPSCSGPRGGLDEASGKPPADVDIPCGQEPHRTRENTSAGAPRQLVLDL